MIEQQQHQQQGMYCCFVDFKKAYDSVPRDMLWQKLERIGVQGWMLQAIKTLYHNVQMCVKGDSHYSIQFTSQIGVKQGCPLSPTLFGLYIDDLETIIVERANGLDLPALGDSPLPPLLYADDLALVSSTYRGLQKQLDLLEDYATDWGLTLNTAKTVVVVFQRGAETTRKPTWTYAGKTIQEEDSFTYLGTN
jgi:hypothetical protein